MGLSSNPQPSLTKKTAGKYKGSRPCHNPVITDSPVSQACIRLIYKRMPQHITKLDHPMSTIKLFFTQTKKSEPTIYEKGHCAEAKGRRGNLIPANHPHFAISTEAHIPNCHFDRSEAEWRNPFFIYTSPVLNF